MTSHYYSKKYYGLTVIAPSILLLKKMGKIISGLKDLSRRDFQYVIKLLSTIFITPYLDFNNELFTRNNIWFVDKDFLDRRKEHPSYMMGGLVHEAFHREQFLRGEMRRINGWAGEKIEKPAQRKEINFYKRNKLFISARIRAALFVAEPERFFKQDKKSDMKYERLLKAYKAKKLKIIEL